MLIEGEDYIKHGDTYIILTFKNWIKKIDMDTLETIIENKRIRISNQFISYVPKEDLVSIIIRDNGSFILTTTKEIKDKILHERQFKTKINELING